MNDTLTDKRERGFFQVDNEIIENYQLSPYSGWLYCVISKYADGSTGEAFPSLNTLAKEANMSKPAVIKHMAELEKRNLIRVKRERINAKKNAVNHYFLQPVVKNTDLELLKVVNEVNHVVNEVDRNKTQVNKTKEKDIPPAKEAAGLDVCETCNDIVHTVIDTNGTHHTVCMCGEDKPLITMNKRQLAKMKADVEAKPDPFADKNDPNAPTPTPLHVKVEQPRYAEPDGRKVGRKPYVDPAITAAIPDNSHVSFGSKKRLDLGPDPMREEQPIAQKPANAKAETLETAQAVQEAEPKAETKASKKKPKHSKEQRNAMNDAVLDAVGWKQEDVPSWPQIAKITTKLLDKGITVELVAEWRDWNSNLQCGKSENPGALVGNAWPRFMKWKREQTAKRQRPIEQPLAIHVDEEYL